MSIVTVDLIWTESLFLNQPSPLTEEPIEVSGWWKRESFFLGDVGVSLHSKSECSAKPAWSSHCTIASALTLSSSADPTHGKTWSNLSTQLSLPHSFNCLSLWLPLTPHTHLQNPWDLALAPHPVSQARLASLACTPNNL